MSTEDYNMSYQEVNENEEGQKTDETSEISQKAPSAGTLIELVRSQPCLWDKSHAQYKNAKNKPSIWKMIAEKANFQDAKVAQAKWDSLRNYYIKEKKKRPSGSGSNEGIKWPYFGAMSFLDKTLAERQGHQSNIQREETVEESEIQQREGSFNLNEELDAEDQTTSSRCTSPSNLAPKVIYSLTLLWFHRKRTMSRPRKFGIHPIIRQRQIFGEYHHLFPQLKMHPDKFFEYMRMNLSTFNRLKGLIHNRIGKYQHNSISVEHRLVITLRFLATGTSFRTLSFSFRLGRKTVADIINDTCGALYDCLHDVYLKMPQSSEEWLNISKGFWERWNIPNTLGAIDGKHIVIKNPPNSGSLYFNYKGNFSTVLMAVCDHKYRLLYVDIGSYGHNSDGGIFDKCDFNKGLENGSLNLPTNSFLPGTNVSCPFFFVADAAFPLKENLMKPLPGSNFDHNEKIYNYRISRARRIIENVFGIMAAKWRILLKAIECNDATADLIVKAICVLHNFVIDERSLNPTTLADSGDDDNGLWRQEILQPLESIDMRRRHANAAGHYALENRRKLIHFFNGIGMVPWQENMI